MRNIYKYMPYSIQTLGINLYEFKDYRIKKSRLFGEYITLLKESEKWDKDQIADYQVKLLKNIVVFAYKNVPFYKEIYNKYNVDIDSIKSLESLESLPIITKQMILENREKFVSKRNQDSFVVTHTSGTTGTPLNLRISKNLEILYKAISHRRDLLAGCIDGDWKARFVGDSPVKNCSDKKLFRISFVNKRIIFPSYCLNINNLSNIFNDLARFKVKHIQAYPSTAYLLAKYLEFEDRYFPLKSILYSSEPLHLYQRELIKERFMTQAYGFFGQAERVITATECKKENYHLTSIDGVLEIIKDNISAPLGEKGLTVATSLHNYSMPLIRYALNDYTGIKNEICDCGRTLPICYNIKTKHKEQFIITPDLRIISPSIITFPLKHASNIYESQVIQEDINRITLNIVPNKNFDEEDKTNLVDSFRSLLGPKVEIKVELMDLIPRANAFKKQFVINKIGEDYIEKAFNELY